jgi:hypothetical protein
MVPLWGHGASGSRIRSAVAVNGQSFRQSNRWTEETLTNCTGQPGAVGQPEQPAEPVAQDRVLPGDPRFPDQAMPVMSPRTSIGAI